MSHISDLLMWQFEKSAGAMFIWLCMGHCTMETVLPKYGKIQCYNLAGLGKSYA
jgi:hypothetical protein